MRRALTVGGLTVASVLLASGLGPVDEAEAGGQGPGLGWNYSSSTSSYWQRPAQRGSGGPPEHPAVLVMWGEPDNETFGCPEPFDSSTFICEGGLQENPVGNNCSDSDEDERPTVPKLTWRRDVPDPWSREEAAKREHAWIPDPPPAEPLPGHWTLRCAYIPEDHVVTKGEIHDRVDYQVFQKLSGLEVQTQPTKSKGTLIQLDTIAYTPYPGNIEGTSEAEVDIDPNPDAPKPEITIRDTIPGHVEPFDYTIRATADLSWTFQDSEPRSGTGRGHKYNGTLPKNAAAGYYVVAKFVKVGVKQITLGATWNGKVQVLNGPDQGEYDIEPVKVPQVTDTILVKEKQDRLAD